MSVLALAAIALQALPAPPYAVDGRCEYPADLAKAQPLAVPHECRRVEIGESEVVFVARPERPAIRFRGDREGDRLNVTAIVIATILPDPRAATAASSVRTHPPRPSSAPRPCTAASTSPTSSAVRRRRADPNLMP